MTNRQRAIDETVKFFLITVTISATIGIAVASGYASWIGIAACVAMLIYGAIMIYEIKLSQFEALDRLNEKN